MKEKKYNLFFDYLNSFNAEHIKKNIYHPSNKTSLSNISNYINNNKIYSKNINPEYNSISLNEKIKERKKAFNNIYISINKILNKYKNNNNIINESNKENQDINIKNKLNNKNVNRIAEHLINTFSKDELKLIKEKINNKMEEDDEPKPEIYLPYHHHIKNKKSNKKLKMIDNLINVHNKHNKYKTFDRIKLNIENKNPKEKFNNKKIIKRNSNNNNTQINSTFLTYAKCKTSFECLDNLIKKRKNKNKKYNKLQTEFNINIKNKNKNKTPNRSTNISSKYLIKSKIKKKEKEEKNEYTYTPIKYINHKYDYIKSLYKNDKFLMKRIKDKMNKNNKKYEKIKEEQNKEILDQCTFKPNINRTSSKAHYNRNNKIKYNLTETNNKNLTYIDFYQYKKNMAKKRGKNQIINKSLTLKENPKKLTKTKSDKKKNLNKNKFLEFHQLIIQKSLKELNDSNSKS